MRANQFAREEAQTEAFSQVTMGTGPSANPPMPALSATSTTATQTTATPTTATTTQPAAKTTWLTYALVGGALWYFFLRKSR